MIKGDKGRRDVRTEQIDQLDNGVACAVSPIFSSRRKYGISTVSPTPHSIRPSSPTPLLYPSVFPDSSLQPSIFLDSTLLLFVHLLRFHNPVVYSEASEQSTRSNFSLSGTSEFNALQQEGILHRTQGGLYRIFECKQQFVIKISVLQAKPDPLSFIQYEASLSSLAMDLRGTSEASEVKVSVLMDASITRCYFRPIGGEDQDIEQLATSGILLLVEDGHVYFAIVDEELRYSSVLRFLENVRHEFNKVADYKNYKLEDEEDYGNMYWRRTEFVDGEDGELSLFSAGVRVGVGIGLGICGGVGICVGLLVRTYQSTTQNLKRQLLSL
ncbi:hypothetical protein LINPERHAP2_LOCUS35197 [Linum perenne]